MKKFKSFTAVLLAVIMAFGVSLTVGAVGTNSDAVGDKSNGVFHYYFLDDGTVKINGYVGSDTKVTIPSKIDGKKVTVVNGFSKKEIVSVTIPNTVTCIDEGAFMYCENLTTVNIPNSVVEISSFAFWNCYSLKGIIIPDSVTEIGVRAFENCTSLTTIAIPSSVTKINKGTFFGCTSLTRVTIPDSVTEIRDFAFYHCTSLKSIVVPKSVTYLRMDSGAFGYYWEDGDKKIDDFVIMGYAGTITEDYANSNGFKFVDLLSTPLEVGDVAVDGTVDISDATAIQKAVAQIISLTDSQKTAADVNGDGVVDISDATMIQKYVAKIITSF